MVSREEFQQNTREKISETPLDLLPFRLDLRKIEERLGKEDLVLKDLNTFRISDLPSFRLAGETFAVLTALSEAKAIKFKKEDDDDLAFTGEEMNTFLGIDSSKLTLNEILMQAYVKRVQTKQVQLIIQSILVNNITYKPSALLSLNSSINSCHISPALCNLIKEQGVEKLEDLGKYYFNLPCEEDYIRLQNLTRIFKVPIDEYRVYNFSSETLHYTWSTFLNIISSPGLFGKVAKEFDSDTDLAHFIIQCGDDDNEIMNRIPYLNVQRIKELRRFANIFFGIES